MAECLRDENPLLKLEHNLTTDVVSYRASSIQTFKEELADK